MNSYLQIGQGGVSYANYGEWRAVLVKVCIFYVFSMVLSVMWC